MKFFSLLKKLKIRQQTLLGFYSDHRSVSIVELSRKKEGYQIHHATQLFLSHEHSEKMASWDTPENLDLLQQHLLKEKFLTNEVAIALPYSSVLFKQIEIDKALTDLEVLCHLQEKTRQYIHYPASELMIDFEILGVSKKHPDLNEVRWVTAKTQEILPKIKALEAIQLKPMIVEVESYTLKRVANFSIKRRCSDDRLVAVVQIYHRYFLWMVLEKGVSIYLRSENFLDAANLEAMLFNEMHLFLNNHQKKSISLLLVSGLYLDHEIIDSLKKSLKIPVERLRVFDEIGDLKSLDELSSDFLMAAGLAMRVA